MPLSELQETFPATIRIAGIKIRDRGEVKKMGVGAASLRIGDRVMLEVERDLTYGVVYQEPYSTPFIPPMRVMTSILRPATEAETAAIVQHQRTAREGMTHCRERAGALGLDMKLVEVYCSFRRRETTFVYTSEERIDFRQLVRILPAASAAGSRCDTSGSGRRRDAWAAWIPAASRSAAPPSCRTSGRSASGKPGATTRPPVKAGSSGSAVA